MMNFFLIKNIPSKLLLRGRLLANIQSDFRLLSCPDVFKREGHNSINALVNLKPNAQKIANNAKITKPISQVTENSAKPENKIDKSVKKAAESLKTETKNKTASIETDSKSLKNAIALSIEKCVTPLIIDDKKERKIEALKAENTKIELKNDINTPKLVKNSRKSISQVSENSAKPENKIDKSVKKAAEALKTETKKKTASAETDSKSLKNAIALNIEKRVAPLIIIDDKKKRKIEALKTENTKLELKNDINTLKLDKNAHKSKSSKPTEKNPTKIEESSFVTKQNCEIISEANKNRLNGTKPIKNAATVSEAKAIPLNTTKIKLPEIASAGPIDSAESNSIKEQNGPPVQFLAPLPAKAEPPAFCSIKLKVTPKKPFEANQELEVLNKSSAGSPPFEVSSREIFLRQCNLRSDYSTSPQNSSGNQSGSSASASSSPPPPSPPPSSSNQAIWLGAAAAILLGGGFYIYTSSKSDKEHQGDGGEKAEALALPKKPRVPLTSSEIPKEVPYLLIGGGTASFAAFRAIKSHDPKARVMVLSNEIETPYMRPPLSKELWLAAEALNAKSAKLKDDIDTESLMFKQWNGVERSLYYEPHDFYIHPSKLVEEPNGGVAIVRGYTVDKIDVSNHVAVLTDGTEIKYGKCLIATGSTPKNLEIFESAPAKIKERISLFKTIDDFGSLKRNVDKSQTVAIIGGGFLGSELACALAQYGETKKLQIYQIFHEKGNMGKVLPEFLSEWATDRVREEGVNVIPKTEVQGVELVGNNQLKLKFMNGEAVVCDHIIVAVGSEPNVELGRKSGLEVDTLHGGYLVNAELAARNDVYVAGDAACFYDPLLGRRRVEHHDHAVVSGRLAGENMFGLNKPFAHQSMFWSDLGVKIGYEATGVIDSTLRTVSVFAARSDTDEIRTIQPTVQAASNANSEADKKDDFSKGVVFYLRDDKIVGIVLWNVFNRINTARAVISQNKKYDDLNEVAKLFDIHT